MEKNDKQFLLELYKGMAATLEQKNDAYGDSYVKTFDKYGPVLLAARIDDKLSRYLALMNAKEDKLQSAKEGDEKIEDTLEDIIGYASLELLRLHKTTSSATEREKQAEALRKRRATIKKKLQATQTDSENVNPATDALLKEAQEQ